MNSLKLKWSIVSMLFALVFGANCRTLHAQNWQHPGVLVSQAQLDFITQQVNLQAEPFYQEFVNAQKSEYGSLTYTVKGPYQGGVTQCGSYSSPDYGCSDEDSDSAAAYVQALLWYITGNKTYATNAINILNAYGHGLVGFAGFTPGYPCPGAAETCENGPLQAAWDATKWPRAAEIIRYGHGGSAGWAPADVAAFSNMLTNVYEPLLYNGSSDNGNWELSMIEGMMGIAVFNEDSALLAHAQLYWSQRVPAYFYYQPIDGDQQPAFPPGRQGYTTWNGQLIFNPLTSGVAQETCRDLKHTEDGIASSINAAETDHIQSQGGYGVQLYESQEDRLVWSLNLMAGLESAASTTAPLDFCTGSGNKITLGIGTTYAIGYNEYHNRLNDPNMQDGAGTTGLNGTSNTYTWIQNGLLPQTLYSDGGVHMAIFEPLTHYANAPSTPTFVLALTPSSQTAVAGSSTSYTVNVIPWNGYTGNVSLSVTNALPSGASSVFSPTTVSGGSGSSILTVTTSSSAPTGSFPLEISATDGTITNNAAATLTIVSSSSTATIYANSQTIIAGSAIPTLTYTVSPTVALTTAPVCTTTGTSTSPAGAYPITCSAAVLSGYTFTYVPGTLTITPSTTTVTVTAVNQTMVAGGAVPTLTYTVSPSVPLTTNPVCTTTATSASAAGSYPITCSGAVLSGYTFTYISGTLTVNSGTQSFTLTSSPTTLSLVQDQSSTITVTISSQGGFNSAVGLSITGLPSPFETPRFTVNPATPAADGTVASTLTLEAKGATPPGTYTLTITGTSGSTVASTPITLTVTAKN
jgi:MBG domain (YGX type)